MKENIPVLEIKNVSKSFPGVKALQNVSLTAYKGECLALIGENGAGKSTLMKILSGAYYMDEGEIYIDGRKVEIHNPADGPRGRSHLSGTVPGPSVYRSGKSLPWQMEDRQRRCREMEGNAEGSRGILQGTGSAV